ncbi:peptidase U32 family protein [Desulfonatronovibrio hydrogenovorans]|uniref:peptidase U32 family protein n=1 Tax=Desulfonatronovibrio hydrogenovorans TaxID=53245 RepID=UPI00048DEF0D|nr:peptidase U32 family protein [Desulfonatronovibrio hydrogenovorans]
MGIAPVLPELLCPAGDMDRLKTALAFGADAVYLGGTALNLRSKAGGFQPDQLALALDLARSCRARVYYCLNALPLEKDMSMIRTQLETIAQLSPDGIIIADPGVFSLVRHALPAMEIHLSTQANTTNVHSVNFWKDQGVKRVNLSRELSLQDIRAIRTKVQDVELEMFVHGAMCMAISGRCFMSAHLNSRSANQGLCAHPCRYGYRPFQMDLEEETRPGSPVWTLVQEKNHSRIFSAQDLCLVKYLPWLVRNRLDSLKIEGRTKSVSYLAVVTDVYRTALDDLAQNRFRPARYLNELFLISTRSMGSGFFLPRKVSFSSFRESGQRWKKILARIIRPEGPGKWLVQVKEKWTLSQDLELVLPGLRRPPVPAGDYSLETREGCRAETVHSGMEAIFCCHHDQIRENTFVRSAD